MSSSKRKLEIKAISEECFKKANQCPYCGEVRYISPVSAKNDNKSSVDRMRCGECLKEWDIR